MSIAPFSGSDDACRFVVVRFACNPGYRDGRPTEAAISEIDRNRVRGSSLEGRKPHCIVVGPDGRRFVNEANPYMEFGQKMYEAEAVPAWAILDSRHRRDYFWGMLPPGMIPQSLSSGGYMKKSQTLEELAELCAIDPMNLAETVHRFNDFADLGLDPDFPRGESNFNCYYGDPTVKPSPNLGSIQKPPFFVVAIYPGDIGTCGGIVADDHARALRADGSPIDGLYVTGNTSAAAGGRACIGAGALGPSVIFGYIAARHAAGSNA